MRCTCEYTDRMSVMVQIRNVPPELHRALKARAALEGVSISEFLLRELRASLQRPTPREMRERLATREPVRLRQSPAAAVRAERVSR